MRRSLNESERIPELFRLLPSVDELLRGEEMQALLARVRGMRRRWRRRASISMNCVRGSRRAR